MTAYQELEARFRRLAHLSDAAGILHWDMSTMMPAGGAAARSEQLAALQLVRHEILTEARTSALLDEAEAEPPADPWRAANLREMRRRWTHAVALEGRLVEALSKACSACEMAWREARPKSDFQAVRPRLDEVLALVREEAAAKAAALGCEPYDALLDAWEPGGRAAEIDVVFDDLSEFLPEFLGRVLERQGAGPPPSAPKGPFPVERQQALAVRMMEVLGFDFEHGRLDQSLHPFCGGTPDDVRITTRYDDDDFTRGLMGVLHETGHALYERGLPEAWRGQPVGDARAMSVHESQSLLIEMQACRSRAFIAFAAPVMGEAFAGQGPAWTADNLYRLCTRVERGFIRVDADEVTYPAHIILRYRLEQAMLADDLAVADLPGAWNEGMAELLGITPPDDRRGCLQDIHWFDGAWAYFPTYTLGAMAAAQFYDAAKRADAAIEPGIAAGDFAPLLAWLRANVHEKGSRFSADELLRQATGRALDPATYKSHLKARYLS